MPLPVHYTKHSVTKPSATAGAETAGRGSPMRSNPVLIATRRWRQENARLRKALREVSDMIEWTDTDYNDVIRINEFIAATLRPRKPKK